MFGPTGFCIHISEMNCFVMIRLRRRWWRGTACNMRMGLCRWWCGTAEIRQKCEQNLNLPTPVNICLWLRYHHIGRRGVSRQWLGDVRRAHDERFRKVCFYQLAPRNIVTPFASSAGTSGTLDLPSQLEASLAMKWTFSPPTNLLLTIAFGRVCGSIFQIG